jgi:hypothetical protein
MTRVLLVLALLGAISTPVAGQQTQTWITIAANGIERGGFVPRDTPYSQGGPAVSVYVLDRQDVRTGDGLSITGFEFIGWAEEDAEGAGLCARSR